MNKIEIFDKYCKKYDKWFNENKHIYQSELEAIKHFCPKCGEQVDSDSLQ
jgi:hypothetical protein